MIFDPPKKVSESITLGFDLVRVLEVDESIISASFSLTVLRGEDASPNDMRSGAAIIVGSKVKQRVVGGRPGNYYTLEVAATTNAGNIYIERGTIEVVA